MKNRSKTSKALECQISGSTNIKDEISASIKNYIEQLKHDFQEEMDAKNEAYSFILSHSLFFEFKQFHEDAQHSNAYQTAKSWIMQLAVNRKSN